MLFKLIFLAIIFEAIAIASAAKKPAIPSTAVSKLVTDEEFRAPIDKQYKLKYFFKASWFTAYMFCRFHGLQLATIETQEQQAYLEKLIKDYGFAAESFWTSGTDLAQEGRFSWYSTGNLFKYKNWASGQPDNYAGNENCVHLWTNQKWNDVACSTQYYFICEEP